MKVQIVMPGPHVDLQIVSGASRSLWGVLLDAGVEIYEYQPAMYHCKVIIVDDHRVSVGSTNFDDRSLRLNVEANDTLRIQRPFCPRKIFRCRRSFIATTALVAEVNGSFI